MGGVGKTRAAVEYAHRYADDYTALLFVRADSPVGLSAHLAALCGPAYLNLPEKDATALEVQSGAVERWLQRHLGWLLILDSVDSEDAAQAVGELLGRIGAWGHTLITSRLAHWTGTAAALPLDVLDEDAAAEFLLERTDRGRRKQADDPDRARALLCKLGRTEEEAAAEIRAMAPDLFGE